MFKDRTYRPISYHDTWISVDPIKGCPFHCSYCVLSHAGTTGVHPQEELDPSECVQSLLRYRLFVPAFVPLAIGNETDMFHGSNVDYMIRLLAAISSAGIENPIVLVTKAPITAATLARIRRLENLRLVFFLSYSGLPRRFEPNFSESKIRENFKLVRAHGFKIVHFWRPLLPENTSATAIRDMLTFTARHADATVFIGLKVHPELTSILVRESPLNVPEEISEKTGEWLPDDTVRAIYGAAKDICPHQPLYRHSSCAIAYIFGRPNHTATVYRPGVCLPSQCAAHQRSVCEDAKTVPTANIIKCVSARLGRKIVWELRDERIVISSALTQEEYAFLLHNLNYPIQAPHMVMQNLYEGSIYER